MYWFFFSNIGNVLSKHCSGRSYITLIHLGVPPVNCDKMGELCKFLYINSEYHLASIVQPYVSYIFF